MESNYGATAILLLLLVVINPICPILANMEVDVLYSFKTNLQDPEQVLQTWDPTVEHPCRWLYVTCNEDDSVQRIELMFSSLSGQLIPQLGQLKNLQYLILSNNNFTGPIPNSFGNLSNLVYLLLNNNNLTGTIPMSLTSISSLEVLDLSNNRLSGLVPDNGSFLLFRFANNSGLCGPVTGRPCPGSPPFSRAGSTTRWAIIVGGFTVGVALLFVAFVLIFKSIWGQ